MITGDVSVALNRLAISHAVSHKSALGQIVLHNGPFAMMRRLEPIFLLGRQAGLIEFDRPQTAFRTFFGLVVADVQIRVLLGDAERPGPGDIARMAQSAVGHFLSIYGTANRRPAT